jgi:hypothetical protein
MSHGGSIRAAAAECGDAAGLLVQALEAGDHRDLAELLETLDQFGAVHLHDAGGGVRIVGQDRQLPALPGARIDAHAFQHDCQQPGGDLLAGGDYNVVFARIVQHGGLPTVLDQLIGYARHRGHHDGHVVAGIDLAFDVARHIADAVDIRDRRSAELHNQPWHSVPGGAKWR